MTMIDIFIRFTLGLSLKLSRRFSKFSNDLPEVSQSSRPDVIFTKK